MTKSEPTKSPDAMDGSQEIPVSSHPSAPLTLDPTAPNLPTLSAESLEIGSGESPPEAKAPPRYDGYAAKLISPRRRQSTQETKKKRTGLSARQRQQRQHMFLLAALLVSVVGWAVFTAGRTHVEPLPVLTLRDLPRSEAVFAVTAHPPSLFVEVDGKSWNRLSSREQEDLVERTGTAAQSAGYSGVLFRTAAGTSVAQWMNSSGVHLFERRESPS